MNRPQYLILKPAPECMSGQRLGRLRQALSQTLRCSEDAIEAVKSLNECDGEELKKAVKDGDFNLAKLRKAVENLEAAFPEDDKQKL